MGEHDRLARVDRGQSETTGVILIVLIAFILGTSAAAFAFTTFQQEKGVAPSVAFGYEYEDLDSDSTRDLQLVIESESGGIEEGNGFEGEHVHFICEEGTCGGVDGTTFDDVASGSGPDSRFTAGDTLTLDASTPSPEIGHDAVLRIRWEEPSPRGKTVIIGVWRGPDA